jgi:hypothetical protein
MSPAVASVTTLLGRILSGGTRFREIAAVENRSLGKSALSPLLRSGNPSADPTIVLKGTRRMKKIDFLWAILYTFSIVISLKGVGLIAGTITRNANWKKSQSGNTACDRKAQKASISM